MVIPVSELQKIAPSAVIELFELQLVSELHGSADVWRFHAGANMNANGAVVWAGNSYLRFPVEADGFDYSGNGQLPRPKIRVSNILGTITAILLSVNGTTAGNDLVGAKVTRIRTLARYLDAVNFTGGVNPYGSPDPTAELPREIYFVDRKVSETRDLVEFELAAAFDMVGVRAPKRQCIANVCQWVYRSAECGYTGANYWDENDRQVATLAQDMCGKRLSSCQIRFNTPSNIPTAGTSDRLLSGQNLLQGQQLVSANGWYRLILQNDGNLVIYSKGGSFVWSTQTQGSGAVRLSMQADGNLVLYRSNGTFVWNPGMSLGAGQYAVLQNDGNFVVYTASNVFRWNSGVASNVEPLTSGSPLPFGSFPGIGTYNT